MRRLILSIILLSIIPALALAASGDVQLLKQARSQIKVIAGDDQVGWCAVDQVSVRAARDVIKSGKGCYLNIVKVSIFSKSPISVTGIFIGKANSGIVADIAGNIHGIAICCCSNLRWPILDNPDHL